MDHVAIQLHIRKMSLSGVFFMEMEKESPPDGNRVDFIRRA